MIKILRVDHRLLHGQVAMSWFRSYDVDTIFIVNDLVAVDESRKNIMRMAKPSNSKLVMKSVDDAVKAINSGITDKYKMLVVVENIQDAYTLAKETTQIQSINLGGTTPAKGTRNISTTINVTPHDDELLNELVNNGVEVEIRQLPNDKKIHYQDVDR